MLLNDANDDGVTMLLLPCVLHDLPEDPLHAPASPCLA